MKKLAAIFSAVSVFTASNALPSYRSADVSTSSRIAIPSELRFVIKVSRRDSTEPPILTIEKIFYANQYPPLLVTRDCDIEDGPITRDEFEINKENFPESCKSVTITKKMDLDIIKKTLQ